MGIVRNKGTGQGVTFVDVKGRPQDYTDAEGKTKHGSLVVSHRDGTREVLPSNSAIRGYVTSVDVKTTVNTKDQSEINNLQIRFEDENHEEPPVVMSVALGSYFAAKIVGLLNAADLSKPMAFAANSIRAGEKIGDNTAESDNVFPTMRQGADNARLVPTWATGATLPDAPTVTISGKKMKDMTPVNDVVAATIKGIYDKLDAIRQGETGPSDDHGISAEDVAAAAEVAGATRPSQRG